MIVIVGYFSLATAILMAQVKNDVGKMQTAMFSLTEATPTIEDFKKILPPGLALGDIDFELVNVTELLCLPTDFVKSASNRQLLQLKSKYPMQSPDVAHIKAAVMAEIAARNLQETPRTLSEPLAWVKSRVEKVKPQKSPLMPRKGKQKSRENSWTWSSETRAVSNRCPSPLEESMLNRIFTVPSITFSGYPVRVENVSEIVKISHESRTMGTENTPEITRASYESLVYSANPRITKARRSSKSFAKRFKSMEINDDPQFFMEI